jgi:hypothetical protein
MILAVVFLSTAQLSAQVWQMEKVDQLGPGRYSAMRADKFGNLHLAYVVDDTGGRYPLKYAFWDRALKRWFTMNVADYVGICDLTLDSKQRPHISYVDFGSSGKVRYAYWNGTTWIKEAIPLNSERISYYNSISLGPDDTPSISYYELTGPRGTNAKIRLRNVMRVGPYWEVRTVDAVEGSGKFNSQASDAKGQIHIAYANVSARTAGMRYALWDGKKWKYEILEGIETGTGGRAVGYSAYMVLDRDGTPHLTYADVAMGQIKYATRENGRWRFEVVDETAGVAYPDRNSLAFDEEGRPYIGFFDSARGLLKVARREGKRWVSEVVDSGGVGFTSSMQISEGTLYISYTDEAGRSLKVAHAELPKLPSSATVSSR